MSKKTGKKEEAPPAPAVEPKVEEEKKEEVKPAKVEKKRAPKKRRVEKGVHALYKVEGEKVTRLRPTCERCGTGFFMGDHVDRYTCGHCGFTRYKRSEKQS
jgi:small subunit ribosomal protein S27Ae